MKKGKNEEEKFTSSGNERACPIQSNIVRTEASVVRFLLYYVSIKSSSNQLKERRKKIKKSTKKEWIKNNIKFKKKHKVKKNEHKA